MALNNAFTTGQILTSTEMNNMPFGVADWATASSNYSLTTTLTAVPDITVTWTADSTRLYKITYYEPQVRSSTIALAFVSLELRLTNALGTQLNVTVQSNASAVAVTSGMTVMYISTFPSGSRTVVGAAVTTSTTGSPVLLHAGLLEPYIIVEDIGLA